MKHNNRTKARLCLVVCIAAGVLFVLDVWNPYTPDPDIVDSALVFAAAFFLLLEICAKRYVIGEIVKRQSSSTSYAFRPITPRSDPFVLLVSSRV